MSIAGTWRNEYGSLMTLSVGDGVAPGALRGLYRSSTGSVGSYLVAGFAAAQAVSLDHGQPVALSICWHSLGGEQADPSWQWTSGLSGQLSVVDGEEVLTLSHLLMASGDFPGLMPAGHYIDKLSYRRCANPPSAPAIVRPAAATMNHPLAGEWCGGDGTVLKLVAGLLPDAGFAEVSGVLSCKGHEVPVTGFITSGSGTAVSRHAVSLAVADPGAGTVAAMSGTLDAARGTLQLFSLSSRSTTSGDRYAQTSASHVEYFLLPKAWAHAKMPAQVAD
ncbi:MULTISPECIES: avidin/streptavidin family protein [Cupriavidus]|uniref:Avidin family protein n=1 Tax=Cupriavidus pinatubonensis (strain JMP 134 / LMG 1197) TaxID=264198 RepID=Q46PW3_CUPPJ|nr:MULTISPECIES: avidin/streptavidin family protein [Cupriavidus]QYY27558.1 avidin/streptavidin family protein [Cupriavidus pinatubonensis]